MITRRQFLVTTSTLCVLQVMPARSANIDTLWEATGRLYLQEKLWLTQLAYDAGHALLPTMLLACHAQSGWLVDYRDHFERFLDTDTGSLATCPIDDEANRLHYLYLAAQFCKAQTPSDNLAVRLAEKLLKELVPYYAAKPVWGWEPAMFNGGIKGRVRWKLDRAHDAIPRYYSAIFDVDLFTLCALCDLAPFASDQADKNQCVDAASLAGEVLKSRGVFLDDGGWLFQPGAWSDHPDYAYAGWEQISANLEPKPRQLSAEDASHSHRFPIQLSSIITGPDSAASETAKQALRGLTLQFSSKVLVGPTPEFRAPRITNYMDGWNGVYRYGYETAGAGRGYGPFQLSGILAEGWWGFLEHPTVNEVWTNFAKQFPLPSSVVELYVGPNTTNSRHHLVAWPAFFTNGFAELNVRSIVELARLKSL